LFHILSLDKFKEGFLINDRTFTFIELDNFNSTTCAAVDFWDHVLEKFNNEQYKPYLYKLHYWGKLFETSHDLSWRKLHGLGIQ